MMTAHGARGQVRTVDHHAGQAASSSETLSEALRREAVRRGVSILFAPALVSGRRAPRVAGTGGIATTLRRLLAGSGLRARRLSARVFIVEALPVASRPPVPAEPDVIVTAMRHPTRLGDTPVSVVAVGGEELARAHATSLRQLAGLAPSLTTSEIGPGLLRLSVRGAYSAGEPAVGLYYGNVPIAGPSGSTSDPSVMTPDLVLVDVDRVELLRGPQGTLYGSGSLAGTLRILFNAPDTAHPSASVGWSGNMVDDGGAGSLATVVVNRPFAGGRAALRVTGWREGRGGTIDNDRLGIRNADRAVRSGGRAALRWQVSGGWRLDLTGLYQAGRIADNMAQTSGSAPGHTDAAARMPYADRFLLLAADLHGGLAPGLSFDATVSRSSWHTHRVLDFTAATVSHLTDGAACAHYFAPGAGACSAGQMADFAAYVRTQSPSALDQPFDVTSDSIEARLSGTGAIVWTAGVFASRRHDSGTSLTRPVDAATGMIDATRLPTAARAFSGSLGQSAVFADGEWLWRRWLTLSAGVRAFDYRRHAHSEVSLPSPVTGPFDPSGFDQTDRAAGSVGRVRMEVRPAAGILSYVQVASGFRPGGINVVPGLPVALATYRDDRLTSLEWGARATLFGGRAQVDLSAFRQSWSHMQYAVTTIDGAYVFIGNIGSARIDGLELSLRWRILPWLGTRIEATGTDARLTSDQASTVAMSPGRAGDRLPNVAPAAAAGSLLAERSLGAGLRLTGTATLRYAGRTYDTFRNATAPRMAMGGGAAVDLDAAIARGPWQVSVYVQNAADARPVVWAVRMLGQGYRTLARPRTTGISFHREL